MRTPAFLLGLAVALMLGVSPAQAEKVGVAAAVNPDAFSSLSGTPNKQLSIGKSIFYNERINTTSTGLVQVLLNDSSTFTVGANSDLVIDSFAYDPRKKSGKVVASFSKGVMRFVGGKISKNVEGVSIKTSAGALAIRGGMVQGWMNGKKGLFSFLYGENMTLTTPSGKKYVVYEPGYTLDLTTEPPTIRKTTPADIKAVMDGLTNGNVGSEPLPTQASNGSPSGARSSILQNDNTSLQPEELIDTATQEQLFTELQQDESRGRGNTQTAQGNAGGPGNPGGGSGNNGVPGSGSGNPGGPGGPGTPPPGDTTGTPPPGDTTGTPPPGDTTGTPPPGDTTSDLPDATPGTPGGYAAGFERGNRSAGSPVIGTLSGVSFNDDGANTLSFGLDGRNGDVAEIKFGNITGDGTHVDKTAIAVMRGDQPATKIGGDGADLLPPTESLCDSCDFLKWGTWDAHLNYEIGKGKDKDTVNTFATGWWVSGERTLVADLNELGKQDATATYSGTAHGTVENAGTVYSAKGDLFMGWNFASRSGTLEINDFDKTRPSGPVNLSGTMIAPGVLTGYSSNSFSGPLNGSGLTGSAAGSFVNRGNIAAGGVMGNWNVGGSNYRATGIFGGAGTPTKLP